MKIQIFPIIALILLVSCSAKKYQDINENDINKKFRIYKDFKDKELDVFVLLNDSNLFKNFSISDVGCNPNFKRCLEEVADGNGFIISNGTNVQILSVYDCGVKVKVICCEPNINKVGWIENRYFVPIEK
jgi:hypothetical protein